MKSILVLISFYLPGIRAGGPIRNVANVIDWLGDTWRFKVLTSNRDMDCNDPYPDIQTNQWYRVGNSDVRYLDNPESGLLALARTIRTIPHDLVYVDGLFSNMSIFYVVLRWLRILPEVPAILSVGGGLKPGALQKRRLKKQVFLTIAKLLGFYRNRHYILRAANEYEKQDILNTFPGAKVQIFSSFPAKDLLLPEPLNKVNKTAGEAHFVFLSRISLTKNLDYALRQLGGLQGKIRFDIWGPLEEPDYWETCKAHMSELPANIIVEYKGVVSFDKTLDVFSKYHLFYFPTRTENFGYAILEALCAGCPVLTSNQTPWDRLEENKAGWWLSLDEPQTVQKVLQNVIDMDNEQFRQYVDNAHKMGTDYLRTTSNIAALRQIIEELLAEPQTV